MAKELPEGARIRSMYFTAEDINVIERAEHLYGEKFNSVVRRILQEWGAQHA